jgi:hypothetical protein
MSAAQDIEILRDAGIDDPETVITAAAAFLRAHPLHVVGAVENALSEEEAAILARHGAKGLQGPTPSDIQASQKNTATIAGEFAQMVSTALSQKQTAARLQVSASRIRQRIDGGSLYALESKQGRVCPLFQFINRSTLPGLERVLQAMSAEAHPVLVQRFFLDPKADLVSDLNNQTLSPRDWLIAGHDVDIVCRLAGDI